MKTEHILKAIENLTAANNALVMGNLSIRQQIDLANLCWSSAYDLRRDLIEDVPNLDVDDRSDHDFRDELPYGPIKSKGEPDGDHHEETLIGERA